MNTFELRIEHEADLQWRELEQTRRSLDFRRYLLSDSTSIAIEYFTRESEITVYLKNGKIHVDFSHGSLRIDAQNMAAAIRALPDIRGITYGDGNSLSVALLSVRNVEGTRAAIADIVRHYTRPIPVVAPNAQLSLF